MERRCEHCDEKVDYMDAPIRVRELIEKLQRCDPDARVYWSGDDDLPTVEDAEGSGLHVHLLKHQPSCHAGPRRSLGAALGWLLAVLSAAVVVSAGVWLLVTIWRAILG